MSEKKKADLNDGFTMISNTLLEAMYKCPALSRADRVLMFIIYQTYGYHHSERPLSFEYIGQGVGISREHACDVVQKLVAQKIIVKRFEGKGQKQILRVNTNVSEWVNATRK